MNEPHLTDAQLDLLVDGELPDQEYRQVLANPDGEDHANIRAFMRNGWKGIRFDGEPLRLRQG